MEGHLANKRPFLTEGLHKLEKRFDDLQVTGTEDGLKCYLCGQWYI